MVAPSPKRSRGQPRLREDDDPSLPAFPLTDDDLARFSAALFDDTRAPSTASLGNENSGELLFLPDSLPLFEGLDLTDVDLQMYFDELLFSNNNNDTFLTESAVDRPSSALPADVAALLAAELPSKMQWTRYAPSEGSLARLDDDANKWHLHLAADDNDSMPQVDVARTALCWNRALQAHIRADLALLDNAIRVQGEYARRLALLMAAYNRCSKRRRLNVHATDLLEPDPLSRSVTVGAFIRQALNPPKDSNAKQAAAKEWLTDEQRQHVHWIHDFYIQRVLHRHARWPSKDREALAAAIRQQNQRLLLDALVDRLRNSPQPDEGHAFTMQDFQGAVEQVNAMDKRELAMNVVGLDWQRIARAVPGRTVEECRVEWMTSEHPLINRAEWTGEEVARLRRLTVDLTASITSSNSRAAAVLRAADFWTSVADALGTNRTAFQVASYYQAFLNPRMSLGRWTSSEDTILLQTVAELGPHWNIVAEYLDGRTGQQCMHRYMKSARPDIKKGRWTTEEDEALRKAVEQVLVELSLAEESTCPSALPSLAHHQPQNDTDANEHAKRKERKINWSAVARLVPNRTDSQCRERWLNSLDPDLYANTPWAEAEDELLTQLVAKHGHIEGTGGGGRRGKGKTAPWSKIASYIKGRTDAMCARRWAHLQKRKSRGKARAGPSKQENAVANDKRQKPAARAGKPPVTRKKQTSTNRALVNGPSSQKKRAMASSRTQEITTRQTACHASKSVANTETETSKRPQITRQKQLSRKTQASGFPSRKANTATSSQPKTRVTTSSTQRPVTRTVRKKDTKPPSKKRRRRPALTLKRRRGT